MTIKKNSRERSPAFQFYAADWLTDPSLRMCSHETRGVWIDLLCIMFLSDEIGVLKINEHILDSKGIQKLSGMNPKKFKKTFDELTKFGIIKVDDKNRYYSKRMVNDERIRQIRRDVGHLGGNPKLIQKKSKGSNLVKRLVNQTDNQNPSPSSSSSSSLNNNKDIIIDNKKNELMIYIDENCPNIKKMKSQLNFEQSEKIMTLEPFQNLCDIVDAMENFKPLVSKYTSVNLTIKNWLKNKKENGKSNHQTTNVRIGNSKPNFDDAIRNF
jgi:hypothetical protein